MNRGAGMNNDLELFDPNNKRDFHERLFALASMLPEWPCRPLDTGRIKGWWEPPTDIKDEAVYVVLDGDIIEPIFFDDPRVRMAVLVGFDKNEYHKARAYLKEKGAL